MTAGVPEIHEGVWREVGRDQGALWEMWAGRECRVGPYVPHCTGHRQKARGEKNYISQFILKLL